MVAGVDQAMVVQVDKKDDNRKSNKPIMEKRRRARINNCLNELKTLILDAMKKDPASHSKLEKADILEMTVKHLGGLRSNTDRFRAGYRRCLSEVAKFPGLETEMRQKLVRHLEGLVPGIRPTVAPTPPSDVEDTVQSSILISAGLGSGVHLVPKRLPNGDTALLLPASVSPNPLGTRSNLVGTFGAVSLIPLYPAEPSSPASSRGSPPPAHLAPRGLVMTKTLDGKPWRPW